MNKRIKKKKKKQHNKWLCERYPFLIPRTGEDKAPWDYPKGDFCYVPPYTFTEVDYSFPPGWWKAFGLEMVEELRTALLKVDYLYDYRVVQIKEKYGQLRWYDNGVPNEIYREVNDIIDKYTDLSERTCICCGRPATKISLGWISPYCDSCAQKYKRMKFKNIEEE